MKGKNLKNLDGSMFGGGLSDPYVLGWVNSDKDTMARTRVIDNVSCYVVPFACETEQTTAQDLNPVWNEYLVFGSEFFAQTLTITVMDHDDVSADDVIGTVEVVLDHLADIEHLGTCLLAPAFLTMIFSSNRKRRDQVV